MPFTFSHPAIVLPLSCLPKRWFSCTGLIIGSMTPDFEYFIRMKIKSEVGHTLIGLIGFNLPLGIILAFVFHNIVRNTLFDQLPECLQSRFYPYRQLDWTSYFTQKWLVVLISISIGTLSHIFWDGFTHINGYFVTLIPILQQTTIVFGKQFYVSNILQHVSTVLGALAIFFAIYKMPMHPNVSKTVHRKYWSFFLVSTLFIVGIRFSIGINFSRYGDVIVSCIGASLLSLVITSLFVKRKII